MAALAASWGLVAILVAAVDLGAPALTFGRLVLGAGTLAVVAIAARRLEALRPGRRLPSLVLLGVLQGVHWLLFFVAVKEGSVALAVLTFYSAPLLIALAAPAVLGERIQPVTLAALVPAAVGIGLVALSGEDGGTVSAGALLAGLGSAATYAALVLVGKRLLLDLAEPLTIAFWDCLIGALAVAPVLLAADAIVPRAAGDVAALAALGVVFTGVSTLVYTWLLRRVTAQAAGLLTFLEPVAAVLLAALLLDEALTWTTAIGGLLVLAAGVAVVVLEPEDAAVDVAAVAAERQ
jgi:drug/metabolite transporter (DMT)-like permease